jgi:poly(3-hydroxybutyrate) depolymerase
MRPQLSNESAPPKPENLLFAGGNQPARRDFGISAIVVDDTVAPIRAVDAAATPFCALIEFSRTDVSAQPGLLIVAPLSGHFPVLLRDLVLCLLPSFKVYVTDWFNVRHVPANHGSFGLDDNISCILNTIISLPPGLTIVALCQGGIPALAATALLARNQRSHAPKALILIACPIDPLANPSGVARLLRSRPPSWFESSLIKTVPDVYAGVGRHVYPADLHLVPLLTYLTRRILEGGEIAAKVLSDDGSDPGRFPFLDLVTSIMDLDAKYFLENTKAVFQECLLPSGLLLFQGERVDLRAIEQTALFTIEGELDDIAPPGQTSAAHALCSSLPADLHHSIAVPGSGHFSLFHGNTCRRVVQPAILDFLRTRGIKV